MNEIKFNEGRCYQCLFHLTLIQLFFWSIDRYKQVFGGEKESPNEIWTQMVKVAYGLPLVENEYSAEMKS